MGLSRQSSLSLRVQLNMMGCMAGIGKCQNKIYYVGLGQKYITLLYMVFARQCQRLVESSWLEFSELGWLRVFLQVLSIWLSLFRTLSWFGLF